MIGLVLRVHDSDLVEPVDGSPRSASGYLKAQVAAGAQAIQLLDSWVGALAREDYESRVVRHTRAIFRALEPLGVPRIHFGTNTPGLLEATADSGPDIVSLDWRLPLDEGWRLVGHRLGVQGNLDPAVLLGPPDLVRERARDVLHRATCCTARAAATATSSTWDMASCPTRPSRISSSSSTPFIPGCRPVSREPLTGILCMAYGTPATNPGG